MKKIDLLSPFQKMLITVGNLPTAYIESMSYYEGLTYLVNYLVNNVIPAVNNNGEAVKELQAKYVELANYIDEYFDDLNIQTEINNKLDEMAQEGELTTLITSYLQMDALLMFDTKSDLKAAENLANGSFVKTLGDTTYDDGYGYYYKIRDLQEGETPDDDELVALTNYPTLVAEQLIDGFLDDLYEDVGTLSNLTTTDKDNIVDAINELDGEIGNLSTLTTTADSTLVSAINEVDGDVGDLSTLTTTATSDVVSAVNEVNSVATGVVSAFNISNYHNAVRQTTDIDTAQITLGRFYPTLETFTSNSENISNVFCNIYCATNNEGTVGKIYGLIYCTTNYTLSAANGYPCLRFRASDFNVAVPDAGFDIYSAGVNHGQDRINAADIYVGSDGYIYLYGRANGSNNNDPWQCVYTPAIYFFRDFGDNPEE